MFAVFELDRVEFSPKKRLFSPENAVKKRIRTHTAMYSAQLPAEIRRYSYEIALKAPFRPLTIASADDSFEL